MSVSLGTRRSTWRVRRGGRAGVIRVWLRRFGFILGAVLLLGWLGAWLYLSGGFTRAADWTGARIFEITSDMGFRVEDILVEGRVNADAAQLLAVLDRDKGSPIFSFDPAAAKREIEKLSWVKSVRVERRLPDTIFIRLEERKPLALWQRGDEIILIDEEGKPLAERKLSRFKDLMLISGAAAPEHAPELMGLLAAEPLLKDRAESAAWIGGRRWNVKLKGNILLRLPEDDVGLALRRLAKAQEEGQILNKDITDIDLREPGRMIVRTREGAARDYESRSGNDI